MKHLAPCIALLALFLLLATLYHCAVPLGEGPDEAGHMQYVLFLAREGRLPMQGSDAASSDVPGEGHQPPLAYLLALPAVAWLPPDAPHFEQTSNPHFIWNGGSESAALMRASREYWPWRGVVLAWHLARGISALLGAVAVACVWGAAHELQRGQGAGGSGAGFPLLAAALVALNPQFLFTSALVTNDVLLVALAAALLWHCLAWSNRARASATLPTLPTLAGPLLAGVLFGLALLTKQSALLLVVLPLWASWSAAHLPSRWSSRRFAVALLCWGGAALLVAGWWYLRNWRLYGDPLGMEAFRTVFMTQPFAWQHGAAWLAALERLHTSFWGCFGWVSLPLPAWLMLLFFALEAVALVGLLHTARSARLAAFLHSGWLVVGLLPMLAFAWVVSFAFTAGLVAWQGRMLFAALPAIALLLARGIDASAHRLSRPPLLHHRLVLVPAVLLCAVAVVVPLRFIAPAYVWHTLPPAVAQAQVGTPVYARYAKPWEQGAELRGWRLERSTPTTAHTHAHDPHEPVRVQAGERITITLTWHALERIEHNWTVFLHLVDDAGAIVAEDNAIPQQGAFPMPQWTPGDWLHDPHTLTIPPDLPAGEYVLRVGLYLPWQRDPQSGRRLDTWARDGTDLGDYAEVGTLRVY